MQNTHVVAAALERHEAERAFVDMELTPQVLNQRPRLRGTLTNAPENAFDSECIASDQMLDAPITVWVG